MKKVVGKTKEAMLRIVQDHWPSCCDIRAHAGNVEVAVYNTGGGKHWISLVIAPYDCELALYKESYIDTLTPRQRGNDLCNS